MACTCRPRVFECFLEIIFKLHGRDKGEVQKMADVVVVVGSKSDLDSAAGCADVLKEFGVDFELAISSAHRSPERTRSIIRGAAKAGAKVIIAAAGAAAHLGGFIASETILPVIGVPLASTPLGGIDALLSMAQMPAGIPVATMAIGSAGAKNAAILAIEILALSDEVLKGKLIDYRAELARKVEMEAGEFGA